jgi:hypothetical protein
MQKSAMTLELLRNKYKSINVTFKDDISLKRALLYYSFVEGVYEYFVQGAMKKTLADTVVGGYEKIAPAFTAPGFLNGLCSILDRYLVDAINEDLKQNKVTYKAYFEDIYQNYPNSITQFFDRYSNVEKALLQISGLFRHNITTACHHVLDDWGYIQGTFVTTSTSFLDKLIAIQSTGSDFHKGGQQVLILTFSLQKSTDTVRVVYKPSDLEVDCLIIGDTAAVNFFRPRFQETSLMELLNTLMKSSQDLGLLPFPTYKILPVSPGSMLTPAKDGSLPLRNSYGYLQFLDYDGYLSPTMNEAEVCQRYYTLLGQIAAVAAAFSLSDLHIQNLLVHDIKPYLIDLENALTRPILEFADTEMVGQGAVDSGAINGVVSSVELDVVKDTDTQIKPLSRYSHEKNRLWSASKEPIANKDYLKFINVGFMGTMQLINTNLKHFTSWFQRLRQGAIARIVPRGSDKFHAIVVSAFSPKNKKTVNEAVLEELQGYLTTSYNEWAKDPGRIPPRFLCFQPDHALEDMISGDVPVFYQKLNTSDLLDSWGKIVVVPDTITINKVTLPVKSLLKRNTYYASPPLDFVELQQLAANTSPEGAKLLLKQLKDRIELSNDVKQYKMLVESKEVDQ